MSKVTTAYLQLKRKQQVFRKNAISRVGISSENMRLQPKEAGAYIAKHAKWLKINECGVDKIVDEVFSYCTLDTYKKYLLFFFCVLGFERHIVQRDLHRQILAKRVSS